MCGGFGSFAKQNIPYAFCRPSSVSEQAESAILGGKDRVSELFRRFKRSNRSAKD